MRVACWQRRWVGAAGAHTRAVASTRSAVYTAVRPTSSIAPTTTTTTAGAAAVPRRSKRLSYADADAVYCSDSHGSHNDSDSHHLAPHRRQDAVPPPLRSRTQEPVAATSSRGHTSLSTRVRQRWQAALLGALHTPYLGAVAVRALEKSAYAAYVKGSVTLFTRRRAGPPIAPDVADVRSGAAVAAAPTPSPPVSTTTDALLHPHALDCLYIGQSPIHSRGLFTSTSLPRGTRVISEPRRSLLLAPDFLKLLADTHEKLPDTWYYTQPTGSVVELVTQAQPHHLLNHSCQPNVCSGLSPCFWAAAALADSVPLLRAAQAAPQASWMERLTRWPHFADANSFFLTRDVAAGEELTLDYSTRMAPLYAGEQARAWQARSWLTCRCGQPNCRYYVYRPSAEVAAFVRSPRSTRTSPTQRRADRDALRGMAELLALGFDDELALLSYGGRAADVVAYVYGQPLPSLAGSSGIDVEVRRVSKSELLMNYRHVFHLLNETVPRRP